jgi:hypothetical protein
VLNPLSHFNPTTVTDPDIRKAITLTERLANPANGSGELKMPTREVILNLWYVRDEEGIIYSLRAKPYVGDGTDEQKLEFLLKRAKLDYLIAEPFEVPVRFHVTLGVGADARKMPV